MASVGQSAILTWTVSVHAARPLLSQRLLAHFRRRMNVVFAVQRLTDTPDGQGGSTRVWTTFRTLLGAFDPLSSQELLAQAQLQTKTTHRVLSPYEADLDPRMRLVYGGRTFDVHDVTDLMEQHLLLELMVEERFLR